MLQVTTNQNTSPCQHTTNTHSPTPVTHCLTSTSNTNSTSEQLGNTGIAFCSCQTVCGNASLPLGTGGVPEIAPAVSRHVSCWKNVLQYIHRGCSVHRRCFAGDKSFSSKCRKLPTVAVIVPCCSPAQLCGRMTVTTPHTAAEGRQAWGTSQGHLDNNGRSFA
jgi:hypothetical protein